MGKKAISIILFTGIVILINVLSNDFYFRIDLTEDKEYTLSSATKSILKNLDQPVTVQAYFTENLPPDLERYRREFRDMLVEFSRRSGGNVEYTFIDPNNDPALEQEAAQSGIQPRIVNVREKDQFTQQKAYMGAVISMGEQQETLPFIGPGVPLEYELTTAIKKMAVVEKPSVGFISGHGEPGFQQLGQVYQALSVIFSVEEVDLNAEEAIPPRFKTLVLLNPADSLPPLHLDKLDNFLLNGGRLVVAIDAVEGDLSTQQGTAVNNNIQAWLASKGIEVEQSFVVDASCGRISVQQRQGFFTINTPVQFPFLPVAKTFPEHPATEGLEQVIFEFVSPVRFIGDTGAVFQPLVQSSGQSGIYSAPTFFNVANRKWTNADFPLSNVVMGGVLEGGPQLGNGARLVVFGDGDFPLSQEGRAANPDNINLLVNTVEWLSDDTGLTALRTKGVSSRPIEEMEDSRRSFLKYLNFFLPIVLAIAYGLFRSQRNKAKRMRRMQESYV